MAWPLAICNLAVLRLQETLSGIDGANDANSEADRAKKDRAKR